MSQSKTLELPEPAHSCAQERARQEGFSSVEEYLEILVLDDYEAGLREDAVRERLREGTASGSAGPLTRERLAELVTQGTARAQIRK